MKRFSFRAVLALFGLIALALGFGVGSGVERAYAQTTADVGLEAVGNTTRLSAADPRTIVVRVINISLSFIGIILVAIIVYAGFLWMTSGGDNEKIEKAKRMIRNAIIGVLIIVSSWAITKFVLNALTDATTGGGRGAQTSGGGAAGGSFGSAGLSGGFYLMGIEPAGTVSIRNVQVRFLFTQEVTTAQVNEHVRVTNAAGVAVPGRLTVEGDLVSFTPSAACPSPASDRFCFDANTDYIAKVDSSMRSSTGQGIACGGLGAVCEGRFHTGDQVDTTGPSVSLLQPYEGESIPQNRSVELIGSANDEHGISLLQFTADGRTVGRVTPAEHTSPMSFEGRVTWSTVGVSVGPHRLQAIGFDLDSNTASSTPVSVMVRPESCFNEEQDGDETGVDCGGSCGACTGSTCHEASECATAVCSAGRCVEHPVITAITPNNGRVGTIVTISGANFGENGVVTFSGGVSASFPARCSEVGGGWTDHAVIVEVPVGAQTGPIIVKNGESGLSDGSDDGVGPRVGAYTVNELTHPGLCAVTPDHGTIGSGVRLLGAGFGSSSDRVQIGESLVTSFRGWTDDEVQMSVPTMAPGSASVRVRVADSATNPAPFMVEAAAMGEGPVIESIDPPTGPVGQYITVHGRNFGDLAGVVQFVAADGSQGLADTTFPVACDLGTRYWSNTAVTFKVPASVRTAGLAGSVAVAAGNYQVYVQRRDGSAPSNRLGVTVTSGEPGPGLCDLAPDTGPVGTEIRLTGERFGSEQGTVQFKNGAGSVDASRINEWTDQSVRVVVPPGARTGSVHVRVRSQDSNGLPYNVRNCSEDTSICSTTERCCEGSGVCVAQAGGVCPATDLEAHYAWRLSTGELTVYPEVINECNPASHRLASPSPWAGRPGGSNACVNADLIVRFSTRIDPAQVNASTVVVRACPAETGDCSTGTVVAPAVGFPRVETADTDSSLIRFRPSANSERWTPATHYQVTLTTGIRSDQGIAMPEQAATCGEGNAYCFGFSTRSSAEPCTVGSVLVNPGNYHFNEIDETTDVHANPLAADDVCLQLNPDSYAWTWSVHDRADRSDARVTVSTVPGVAGQRPDQAATAMAEVPDTDPSLATAAVTVGRSVISGNSEMSVELRPFVIDAYGPNCDQACVNAAVWAQFSVPVQASTVIPGNFELRHCADAECRTMDEPFTLPSSAIRLTAIPGAESTDRTALNRFILIRPTPLLRAGQVYRMLLRSGSHGGLTSARGKSLNGLNDERGFAWKFQVKSENEGRCSVDRVELAPEEKIEQVIGARQRFTAMPVSPPDACSETGEILVSESPYTWSTVDASGAPDATVARLVERTDEAGSVVSDAVAPVRTASSRTDQQLAEIIATRDPGVGETRLTTTIQASYEEKTGHAVYGLQCGQRSEALCPTGSGLTAAGCCAPRPRIQSRFPAVGATGICRNTSIFADFQVPIELGSATATVILAKNEPGTTCPDPTRPLASVIAGLPEPAWYARLWHRVVAFFEASDASANVWCVGAVPGSIEVVPQGTGSRVLYTIQGALEPNTDYRVYVRGATDLTRVTPTSTVIRSDRGVAMEQESVEWTFHTGTSVCQASAVEVDDTFAESPYLFTHHPETHGWRATAQAYSERGVAVPIVPVREYAWTWGPWISSKTDILTTASVETGAPERANVQTMNHNGQSFISARLEITADTLNTPSTTGTVIETAKSAVVQLCEHPWPGRSLGAFTDDEGSPSLRALAPMFTSGPFYHFSTSYCMDAGATTTEDDLPALRLNPVPLRPADADQGILRQYLFTFEDPVLRSDGIGIRIASNPLHLSASRWYAAKGFNGRPQAVTVDGYDAVRDGSTIYVSGSDLAVTGRTVSSVIYIVSRNPDAREQTVNIFDQLVQNFTLNVNLTENTGNVCVQKIEHGDPRVFLRAGRPVACTADWECAGVQTTLTCASDKAKLQRDRARISDVQTVNASLEAYRGSHGGYPALGSGSFIQGLSTSRWPSWEQTLGQDLGAAPPRDPVNRFTSCGRCQAADGTLGKICSENGECSGGSTCVAMTGTDAARNGFDPATCWNATSQRYFCPAIQQETTTYQTSQIYQYRSIDNGGRYEFAVNLEATNGTAYRPSLTTEVRRCSNTNQLCTDDTSCQVRDAAGRPSAGSCRPTGGAWLYNGICTNTEYGPSTACTTVTGPGQVCHVGETRSTACTIGSQAGTKIQVCSDCRAFVDGPATVCTPNVQCGNGRVDPGEQCDDGARNGQYGFCSRTCQAPQGSCGDGVIGSGESCDNGSPVGSPATGAPGVNGAYCGEGCDLSRSCSLDCRAQAPHCGDGTVDPTEQCDGGTQRSQRTLCFNTVTRAVGQECTTDTDCPGVPWICGGGVGGPTAVACGNVTVSSCSGGTASGVSCTSDAVCTGGGRCLPLTYPTYHLRTCLAPGEVNACRYNAWTPCTVVSSCGDGVLDAASGEECDDGVAGNTGTGRCTPRCRLNRCGDGYQQSGREDCDFGGRNGVRPAAIEYGSVGSMCTTECRVASVSGGFCGNGALDAGEACDGDAIPPDASCRALGFDYATTQSGGHDVLSCTSACTIGGCQSCSARLPEAPENTISAVVRDGILQNRALRQARVTLRYNGSTVAETYTDDDGRFHFGGVHDNAACGNYTITISLQGWKYNYMTGVLERTASAADGYYPFTSQSFSYSTFRDSGRVGRRAGSDVIILLAPRPGEGETIVMREWNADGRLMTPIRAGTGGGPFVGQLTDPQLILPRAMGYTRASDASYAGPCVGGTPGCERSINWSTWKGRLDLAQQPHAGLACYEADRDNSCTSYSALSEAILFRRSSPAYGGVYRYFLVDSNTTDDASDGNIDTVAIGNKLRIYWRDRDGVEHGQELAPSAATRRSTSASCAKKYWYAFNQDAVTGRITIVNKFMCNPAAGEALNEFNSVTDDDGLTVVPIRTMLRATGDL